MAARNGKVAVGMWGNPRHLRNPFNPRFRHGGAMMGTHTAGWGWEGNARVAGQGGEAARAAGWNGWERTGDGMETHTAAPEMRDRSKHVLNSIQSQTACQKNKSPSSLRTRAFVFGA